MKSSSALLKPNKIIFTHQSKTTHDNKPKTSSRYSSTLLQKSTLSDHIIMDKISSKKNILGKQNQQKNTQNKQTKRQSNPKLKKASDLYMNQKMNKLNKIYRNQSMHINRDQQYDDIEPFSKLNNSSINQKQNIHKKKKVSKHQLQNLPNQQNNNINHQQQNNSVILNRSSFSDKMIIQKQKRQEPSNIHLQSCKNLQSNKIIDQSKSFKVLQKRTSTTNKPGIYLVKNTSLPIQISQSQRNSVADLIHKNQNKSKNISTTKQPKTQQTSRKIKRTKLGWLILVNNLYLSFDEKLKKSSNDKKIPTLFELVHYLKNFQKKYHPQEQLLLKQQFENQLSERVSLADLLRFFKIVLNKDEIFLPHTVWKQGCKQIDSERTEISFNSFGRVIFSYESIIQQLERYQKRSKFPKPTDKCLKQSQKQHQQQIKHNNNLTLGNKQDEDIVQTARFQHHENSSNSSSVHDGQRQQVIGDKGLRKKKMIFTKHDQELIYQQGVGNLISKKLTKERKGQQLKKVTNNVIVDKGQKLTNNKEDKKNEKSNNIKRDTLIGNNKREYLVEFKDGQKSGGRIVQHNVALLEQNKGIYNNRDHNWGSIEQISQIQQVYQTQKMLITSFKNKQKGFQFSDPFYNSQMMMNRQQELFRNIKQRMYDSQQQCRDIIDNDSSNYNNMIDNDSSKQNNMIDNDSGKQNNIIDDSYKCKDMLDNNNSCCEQNYNRSDQLGIDQCRLQALNMNSSQLFFQSVILNNLYHTNFNMSFSDQPDFNNTQIIIQNNLKTNRYNKLEDIIHQIENILNNIKNVFAFDQDPINYNNNHINYNSNINNNNNNHHINYNNNSNNKLLTKTIRESIKIQDLTEIEDFLSQFIDYKLFKQSNHQNIRSSNQIKRNNTNSTISTTNPYFNAVKLTQTHLTSLQTKKTAANVIKSNLITQYFTYFQAIRINQAPFIIQNIQNLIGNSTQIKILNLAHNQLTHLQTIIKVIENNMHSLQFLNLSNNQITSLECLFDILNDNNDNDSDGQRHKSFIQLRELHLKNNKINKFMNKSVLKRMKLIQKYDFPKLQLLDLRSNMIQRDVKQQIQSIILESPQLSIMSLKLNPIMQDKSRQKEQIQQLLNQKSIYEYDSLQMMSAYIKYKDITFTDSNQGCCSLIENDNNNQYENNKVNIGQQQLRGYKQKLSKDNEFNGRNKQQGIKSQHLTKEKNKHIQ